MRLAADFWKSKTTRAMALGIVTVVTNELMKYADQTTVIGCFILLGLAFIRDCIAKNGLGVVASEPDGEADA